MIEAKTKEICWESLKMRFFEKYFPDSAKFAKEANFMRLEQDDMFVHAYVA